jgi:Zn-dependent metalloprotease
MLQNQSAQMTAKLRIANDKIDQLDQVKAEVESLKQRNFELLKNSADGKIIAEENEILRLEVQKLKAKSQSLMNEVEFLQKQKSDLILGQETQKWKTESTYIPQIEEQNGTIRQLNKRVQELEIQLLESEEKRVDARRGSEKVQFEISNL